MLVLCQQLNLIIWQIKLFRWPAPFGDPAPYLSPKVVMVELPPIRYGNSVSSRDEHGPGRAVVLMSDWDQVERLDCLQQCGWLYENVKVLTQLMQYSFHIRHSFVSCCQFCFHFVYIIVLTTASDDASAVTAPWYCGSRRHCKCSAAVSQPFLREQSLYLNPSNCVLVRELVVNDLKTLSKLPQTQDIKIFILLGAGVRPCQKNLFLRVNVRSALPTSWQPQPVWSSDHMLKKGLLSLFRYHQLYFVIRIVERFILLV